MVGLWGWYRRGGLAMWTLPAGLVLTTAWAVVLLGRTTWQPWLRPAVVACTLVAVVGLVAGWLVRSPRGRRLAGSALAVGVLAVLLGPAAWAVTPLQQPLFAVN